MARAGNAKNSMPFRRLQALGAHLTPGVTAGVDEADAAEIRRYMEEGRERALKLGNRGPLRFDEKGHLTKEILDAYWEHSFYVFEGAISKEELLEVQREFEAVMENAPSAKGSKTDKHGRPVRHPGPYLFARPLSDPQGGTKFGIWDWREDKPGNPRYQIKMREPKPPPWAPERVPLPPVHPMAYMDAALRVYGHPDMLRVAESLNGPDFTPFTEFINYKPAFLGTSSAWHQDPSSAWDKDWGQLGWDPSTCGYNCHLSLYRCIPEQGLWVLPGSHKGRLDIKALSAKSGGTDRLEGAVPILCEPGDVYIQNRLSLHCAFPNTSPEKRCTLTFGFQRRGSVLGKRIRQTARQDEAPVVYDAEFIHERSKQIQLAIDARRQRYPMEKPYVYLPFQGFEDECRWNEHLKEDPKSPLANFWKRDLGI